MSEQSRLWPEWLWPNYIPLGAITVVAGPSMPDVSPILDDIRCRLEKDDVPEERLWPDGATTHWSHLGGCPEGVLVSGLRTATALFIDGPALTAGQVQVLSEYAREKNIAVVVSASKRAANDPSPVLHNYHLMATARMAYEIILTDDGGILRNVKNNYGTRPPDLPFRIRQEPRGIIWQVPGN